ncbi:sulfite exporter TauE/SafE family protein [Coralliovum pocilloporae]|uniref:sulfite exporter TauE/SafE family protein n=1 Tax=Coralliovum pocilloporae TaxID=3066369 RepID=UPI00330769B0
MEPAAFLFTVLPDDLGLWLSLLLIGVSFMTSALTAALGIGGGMVLLAVMASTMPGPALIPVHGVVQLGSNLSRMIIQRAFLHRATIVWFLVGSVVGGLIGGQIAVELPATLLKGLVGIFILLVTWGPKLRMDADSTLSVSMMAALSTILTMFVGVTGPFVAASLSSRFSERFEIVANHAACMSIQHLIKILVFGFLGFAFADWLGLIVLMIGSGYLGTRLGTHILKGLSPELFQRVFKALLTILALNLLGTTLWNVVG